MLLLAESPYGSFREQAAHTLKESYQIPAFPFLSMMEGKMNRAAVGFVSADMELAEALAGSDTKVPAIFLASEADSYIPAEMTTSAYEAYPGEKRILSGGSGHGTVISACLSDILAEITACLDCG